MWEYNYTDELYHYGILGMKWGVRKQKKWYRDGSERTVKKLKKLNDAGKEHDQKRTAKSKRKLNKLYKQYDKSASKDILKAAKSGNGKIVNSISAGRTWMKMSMDPVYANSAITSTAVKAKVKVGKDFAWKIDKDYKNGTVNVTVGKTTNSFVYAPELKKIKKAIK